MYCWGQNQKGQLGDGSASDRSVPVAVAGGLSFASLGVGRNHSAGVTATGEAYAWGLNADGELGDGSTTDSNVPVAVVGGLSFALVTGGANHTCGLTVGGILIAYCWGLNSSGQLGDGSLASRSSPVAVLGQE